MPLICGCSGQQQVIPPKEEKEDVTDLKVIAKIAQFPDVRQMKKNGDEDGSIRKEIQDDPKVATSIETTPSSSISSQSMEQQQEEDEIMQKKEQEDIATVSQDEEKEEQEVSQ